MGGEYSKNLIAEIQELIVLERWSEAEVLLGRLQRADEWWLTKQTSEAEEVRLRTLMSFLRGDD